MSLPKAFYAAIYEQHRQGINPDLFRALAASKLPSSRQRPHSPKAWAWAAAKVTPRSPPLNGRHKISGEVVFSHHTPSDYPPGSRHAMALADYRGFLVYLTIPQSLRVAVLARPRGLHAALSTKIQQRQDSLFAWGAWPRNAQIIAPLPPGWST